MARYKPQEIVRRDAIPSRRAERPILAVHADQEPTRYAGSLMQVTSRGIGMLADIHAQRTTQKNTRQAEEEFNRGADMRRKEDLEGQQDAFRPHILEVASEHYKRGYYKTDAMLQIRNWSAETALQLAQAEPDADYGELVHASKSELLLHPAFQDPQTRQEMLALLDTADQQLYTRHLAGAAREMLTRQEEAMSALIRDRIDSGEPLTNATFDKLYALLDQEEYGYLNKRHVDGLIAEQMTESIAAGREDYAQIVEFLDTRKDENGISLMDGAHGQKLRQAVVAGQRQLEIKAAETRDQAYADMHFQLSDIASRGLMTRDEINKWMDHFGFTGNKRLQEIKYWDNRQQDTLKRWQREAELRRQEAIARELYERNPWGLPENTIRKFLDDEWSRAQTEAEQSTVIDTAISKGVVPSFIQHFLQRGGFADADLSRRQNALYQDLRARDPGFAAQAAGKRTAFYDILQEEVEIGGHPIEALHTRMGASQRTREDAAHVINRAWAGLAKDHPELEVNGQTFELTDLDQFRIRRRAEEILTDLPGVTAEEAWKAARRDTEVRSTIVNGNRVSRAKLPPGGEPAVEALLQSVARRAGLPLDSLAAQPAPGTEREWIVTTKTGFPVTDPDTHDMVVFGTDELKAHYEIWESGRNMAQTRSGQRAQQITRLQAEQRNLQLSYATGKGLYPNTMQRLREIEAEMDALLASPDPTSDHTDHERELAQLKLEEVLSTAYQTAPDEKRYRALQSRIAELEASGTTGGIPDDFATFIQSLKGR